MSYANSYGESVNGRYDRYTQYSRELADMRQAGLEESWPTIISRSGNFKVCVDDLREMIAAGMVSELGGSYFEINIK